MSAPPLLARTRADLALALAEIRSTASVLTLVPTMGALHDGHRALLRRARSGGRTSVASIFVNPLQFGSADDLARYPRELDTDLATCHEEGVALVWAPSVEEMYVHGTPQVTVSAGLAGQVLEGRSRPGHFDGVLTVVAKLFNQVRPEVAVFGAKDAQQLVLVRRMVADLDLGVAVESVDTVRAGDGLALSSRNARLSPAGRAAATRLRRALLAVSDAAPRGPRDAVRSGQAMLDAEPGLVLDYLTIVDPDSFEEVPADRVGHALAVVAAEVEGTRLIDNLTVTLGLQEEPS